MDKSKKQALEDAGWIVGDIGDFIVLSSDEVALIDLKIALADAVRRARVAAGLSQAELAARLGTKQPNVARLELGAGHAATLDLTIRALLVLGLTRAQLAAIVAGTPDDAEVLSSGATESPVPSRAVGRRAAKPAPARLRPRRGAATHAEAAR